MTGHEVAVFHDYIRGGWYARCTEFGCIWQAQAIPAKHEAQARAEGHEKATR